MSGPLLSFNDPRATDLRERTRTYVQSVARQRGAEWEAAGTTPREVYAQLGALGGLGLSHPVEYGGSGLGPVAAVIFAEEISRCTYTGMPEAVLIHSEMASTHISKHGSPEQKRCYLPGMIGGNIICSIAVTEPDAGSDVAAMRCAARRVADAWVLNGTKCYVTNALYGDVFIVAARTDPSVKPSRGLSLFIVERDTPGLTILPMAPKHGMLSSDIASLVFENAVIPLDALIGEENRGFYGIMQNFQNERLVLGAMSLGMGLEALDLTIAHLKARRAFGGTLWDIQSSRQQIAMLSARMQAVRTLVQETAIRSARGEDCVREVSMVKALAGETLQDIIRVCLQLHGGAGYLQDTAIERLGRDARLMTIGGGATEVLLEEVAKRI